MVIYNNPFSKYRYENDELSQMSAFNAAVFDCIVCSFSRLETDATPSYEDFKNLFKKPDFFNSVEGSVNDVSKVKKRIEMAESVIL